MKTALSIAGSDSSGGAGIQADIKTMTMYGVYAMTAITALTAQNTMGVTDISVVTPDFLEKQLDAVFTDIRPDAVKIGMIPSGELIRACGKKLRQYRAENIVVDPVMIATSGSRLMQADAVSALTGELFPLSVLVTPNIPEAETLCGMTIGTREQMEQAAKQIQKAWGCSVLLKGGHMDGCADDLLVTGETCRWYSGNRVNNPNSHGTGCTLSSAIAAGLAKGYTLPDAVGKAKEYITGALSAMLDLGQGSGPVNHMFTLQEE